jgi:hypothetical protein
MSEVKSRFVAFIIENRLAPIAAQCHLIRRAGKFNA